MSVRNVVGLSTAAALGVVLSTLVASHADAQGTPPVTSPPAADQGSSVKTGSGGGDFEPWQQKTQPPGGGSPNANGPVAPTDRPGPNVTPPAPAK